jgi:hypothetical protein
MFQFMSSQPDIALYTCLKVVLIAGTMPPKKPSTRKSLRVPKPQEPETGEGSSPAVARQLEFTPVFLPSEVQSYYKLKESEEN